MLQVHGTATIDALQTESDHPQKGGSITVPLYEAIPETIQPLWSDGGGARAVLPLVFESLVEQLPDGSYEGRLADSWTVDRKQRTITVVLREGVQWHDGEPFTSEDVIDTYHRLVTSDEEGPFSEQVKGIAGASDVQAGKAETVIGIERHGGQARITFHLTPSFSGEEMELLQVPIIPRHLHEKSERSKVEHLIGTGPYRVKEAGRDTLVLERFDSYRSEAGPYLDRLTFQVMSPTEAISQFEQGSVAVLPHLDAAMCKRISNGRNQKPLHTSGDIFHYVALNPEQPLWKDVHHRRAVQQAVNKKQLVQQWLDGYGEAIDTPRGTRAQRSGEPGIEKKEKTLQLHYTSEWIDRDQLAHLLQKQLQDTGLDVKIVKHKNIKKLTEAIQTGQADLFLMTEWVRSEPVSLYRWWTEDEWLEWSRWPSDKIRSALKKAVDENDPRRERLLREWDGLFVAEVPLIPLVRPHMLHYVAEELRGVAADDFGSDRLDVRHWWIDRNR